MGEHTIPPRQLARVKKQARHNFRERYQIHIQMKKEDRWTMNSQSQKHICLAITFAQLTHQPTGHKQPTDQIIKL